MEERPNGHGLGHTRQAGPTIPESQTSRPDPEEPSRIGEQPATGGRSRPARERMKRAGLPHAEAASHPQPVIVEKSHAGAAPVPAMPGETESTSELVATFTTLERWSPLLYIALTTGAEVGFIECYCHWHGAQFLLPNPLNLYSPENIRKLMQIGFVAGMPSVMSITAEILMWSSLGVWAQRIAGMAKRYRENKPDLPYDLAVYIGLLGSHTSIAAAVMIVLKLSGFRIFGISLDSFEATVGIAFMLGYFGEHTERLLKNLREQLFGKKDRAKTREGHT
jgi:hypothetical protein